MVHVYYGTGKGKTTAATGLACRAAGSGLSVWLTHFIKCGSGKSGEDIFLNQAGVDVTVFEGQQHPMFVPSDKYDHQANVSAIESAVCQIEEAIKARKYHMIILDEILNAVKADLITEQRVVELINVDADIELVLTGRTCNNSIVAIADYVSKIEEVKHPFHCGVSARKGIEY